MRLPEAQGTNAHRGSPPLQECPVFILPANAPQNKPARHRNLPAAARRRPSYAGSCRPSVGTAPEQSDNTLPSAQRFSGIRNPSVFYGQCADIRKDNSENRNFCGISIGIFALFRPELLRSPIRHCCSFYKEAFETVLQIIYS